MEVLDLGFAERFKNILKDVEPEFVPQVEVVDEGVVVEPLDLASVLVSEPKIEPQIVLQEKTTNNMNDLKDELFDKIIQTPCWSEFDMRTQYELIVKFLRVKNVKVPEVIARILQQSVLGFGIFDEYLLKKNLEAIFYEPRKPLSYIENGKLSRTTTVLPLSKIKKVVKNIKNMSLLSDDLCDYSFRTNNFWVNMSLNGESVSSIEIYKISDSFLENEFANIGIRDALVGMCNNE